MSHTWGMSTTHVALTAHLVRPEGSNDDAMLAEMSHELHHRSGVEHTTLQIERDEAVANCATAPAGSI
jgi:cobalt-zinc-cadmium efflux system protein